MKPLTVQEAGRLGGKARAARLTHKERQAIARKGGLAAARKSAAKGGTKYAAKKGKK